MNNDILFKSEDFIFSYRVAGIPVQNGKILLQKPQNDEFSLIGGHVSRFETTEEALKREFAEELHTNIEIENLLAVGETFWIWGKTPCHQIGLYYKVRIIGNDIPFEGSFIGYDDLDSVCWVSLEKLKKGLKVYPTELIPHILSGKNETLHFVSRQF